MDVVGREGLWHVVVSSLIEHCSDLDRRYCSTRVGNNREQGQPDYQDLSHCPMRPEGLDQTAEVACQP